MSGGEGPRSQIYTDSLQLSNAFLRRFVAESVLHLLPIPQNSSDLSDFHDPTQPGQGGHAVATLLGNVELARGRRGPHPTKREFIRL